MQRGLIGSDVNKNVFLIEFLPNVYYVPVEGNAHCFLILPCFSHPIDEGPYFGDEKICPSLVISLLRCVEVHLGAYGYASRYIAGLGLCPAHASQAGSEKDFALGRITFVQDLTERIHQGDRSAMNDSLWPDIHVGTCRHLPVLGHAQGVESLQVIGLRIVRNHHSIGDDDPRGFLGGREQTHRVTRVHVKRLLVRHFGEVLHSQQILGPVLEYGTVPSIGDQFLRVLGNSRIQIVLDHEHDGGRFSTFCRVVPNRSGVQVVIGFEPIHVDSPVGIQFVEKFFGQFLMPGFRKIAQGISQGELLLLKI